MGLVAALIALALTVAGTVAVQWHAYHLAVRYIGTVGELETDVKWRTLTLQRAAAEDSRVILMYGSSELFGEQGSGYRGPVYFNSHSVGLALFAVGDDGLSDLSFFQMVAGLGTAIRGKPVVISDTWSRFFLAEGTPADAYSHHFSPEIAFTFAFASPISMDIRRAGARRMLQYPSTLASYPVLRSALEAISVDSLSGMVEYYALWPAGTAQLWAFQVQDAVDTILYLRSLTLPQPAVKPKAGPIDWRSTIANATQFTRDRAAQNPFGFWDETYTRYIALDGGYPERKSNYCAGRNNRDGSYYPYPSETETRIKSSQAWTDLAITMGVLTELGSNALFIAEPLPGAYWDYSPYSRRLRQAYYDQFNQVGNRNGASVLDLEQFDDQAYFLSDPNHYSPRGWAFVDTALYLILRGRSSSTGAEQELGRLASQVPATVGAYFPGFCPSP